MSLSIRQAAFAALVALAVPATSSIPAQAAGEFKVAQACGWYVVLGCFKSWNSAQRRADNIGAIVVDTNEYPNFRNGWFCAADGPYSRSRARQLRWDWKGTVPDAYAKSAC
ncbi:MAG: hypothetical protein AAF441_17980 [Pseudomonadota bacterium]